MFHFRLIIIGFFIVVLTKFSFAGTWSGCPVGVQISEVNPSGSASRNTQDDEYVNRINNSTIILNDGDTKQTVYYIGNLTDCYIKSNGIRSCTYWTKDITCQECVTPDEYYDIQPSWGEATSLSISCGTDPDLVTDFQDQCSALNGVFYAVSKTSCCVNSVCFVPDNNQSSEICPEGQHNVSQDVEILDCICDNNLTKIINNAGDLVCQTAQCPDVYDGLELKLKNVTFSQCFKVFPPAFGWETKYLNPDNAGCCWSSSVKNDDNDSECPTNYIKNSVGVCQEIEHSDDNMTDDTSLCLVGYEWNNLQQRCDLISNSDFSDSNSSSAGSYNGDGNYAGSGGSSDNNETEKIVLEYDNEVVSDILDDYSTNMEKSYSDFLLKHTSDFTELYKISIPAFASCGCENPSYDFVLFGKQKSGDIDICSPLDKILLVLNPLLWFFFLIALAFNFLRSPS